MNAAVAQASPIVAGVYDLATGLVTPEEIALRAGPAPEAH
jgi:hypothetical protein